MSSSKQMNGNKPGQGRRHGPRGFTLVEILVSMTILSMISFILFSIFNQATKAWQASEKQIDAFREARAALFMLRRDLGNMVVSGNMPMVFNYNQTELATPADTGIGDVVLFLNLQPRGAQESFNQSDLCSVGYYVAWSVNDFTSVGDLKSDNNRTIRSYNLFRHFRRGNDTYADLQNYLKPGIFDPANPAAGLKNLYKGVSATAAGDDMVARNITRLEIQPFAYDSAGVLKKVGPGVITGNVAFVEVTLKAINNDTAARLGKVSNAWNRSSNQAKDKLLLDRNEQVFRTRIAVKEFRP